MPLLLLVQLHCPPLDPSHLMADPSHLMAAPWLPWLAGAASAKFEHLRQLQNMNSHMCDMAILPQYFPSVGLPGLDEYYIMRT